MLLINRINRITTWNGKAPNHGIQAFDHDFHAALDWIPWLDQYYASALSPRRRATVYIDHDNLLKDILLLPVKYS